VTSTAEKTGDPLGTEGRRPHNAHVKRLALLSALTLSWLMPLSAHAAVTKITFRHKHYLFTVPTKEFISLKTQEDIWTMNGKAILPAQEWLADGDVTPSLPTGVRETQIPTWNREAIKETIEQYAGPTLNRAAQDVTIRKDVSGKISFEGQGATGRKIDLESAANLTIEALGRDIGDVDLPVFETQPTVTVTDPELKAMGITEIVTNAVTMRSRSLDGGRIPSVGKCGPFLRAG